MNNSITIISERERGKGVGFQRVRRITGFLTTDIKSWNPAKLAELKDRKANQMD